jgi:hypothetical protein
MPPTVLTSVIGELWANVQFTPNNKNVTANTQLLKKWFFIISPRNFRSVNGEQVNFEFYRKLEITLDNSSFDKFILSAPTNSKFYTVALVKMLSLLNAII